MRLTLVHNPEAGDDQPSRDELVALARDAGYRVRYQDAHAKDWARALDGPADVIVVAGGDGTVAKVAKQLVFRDVPVAIMPLGTANNIAISLGAGGEPAAIIRGLADAATVTIALDVAQARAPWGTTCFVESAGTGFFGNVLRRVSDDEARSGTEKPTTPVQQAARNVLRALGRYRPVHRHVLADGEDLSAAYLLVEAMNVRSIGPRMELAPAADPGDGYIDLVLVRETDRRALIDYLDSIADGAPVIPAFETRRAQRVSFVWDVADGHLDDEPWPEGGTERSSATASAAVVEVEIEHPPVRVLVPAPDGHSSSI